MGIFDVEIDIAYYATQRIEVICDSTLYDKRWIMNMGKNKKNIYNMHRIQNSIVHVCIISRCSNFFLTCLVGPGICTCRAFIKVPEDEAAVHTPDQVITSK